MSSSRSAADRWAVDRWAAWSLAEDLVDELDANRAFADRGGDALGAVSADVADGKPVKEIKEEKLTGGVTHLSFTADGKRLAVLQDFSLQFVERRNHEVITFDLEKGEAAREVLRPSYLLNLFRHSSSSPAPGA